MLLIRCLQKQMLIRSRNPQPDLSGNPFLPVLIFYLCGNFLQKKDWERKAEKAAQKFKIVISSQNLNFVNLKKNYSLLILTL
jgi:molecular chaperone DnaK (HSP70)